MARRVNAAQGGEELRAHLLAEAKSILGTLHGVSWPLDRHSDFEPTAE
jgi:hypothetical protein